MRVLVYRYNSICEPDVIATFREFGFDVDVIDVEMERKDLLPSEQVQLVDAHLQKHPADFVFSINFFPALSQVCNIYHIRYISWIVDSPVMELYTKAITNEWNRTFLFDRAIYNEIAPLNPACIFHLPLAARVQEKEKLIAESSPAQRTKYAHDIAFVGSLYTEKCAYDKVRDLPEHLRGYLDAIMNAQKDVYGDFFIEELLSDEMIHTFADCHPSFFRHPEESYLTDRVTMGQLYMGNKITALERVETFRRLSEKYEVSIYTASDTTALPLIHNMGTAKTITEMPLIFHHSKININTTSKAIRTGLPLRIFDILSCGGFVLTNYQAELPELFEIGQQLAAYSSMDELVFLAGYYLEHEDERKEMAAAGYERLKRDYTYEKQMEKMMLMAFDKAQADVE